MLFSNHLINEMLNQMINNLKERALRCSMAFFRMHLCTHLFLHEIVWLSLQREDTKERALSMVQSPTMKPVAVSPLQWIHPIQPANAQKSTSIRHFTCDSKTTMTVLSQVMCFKRRGSLRPRKFFKYTT